MTDTCTTEQKPLQGLALDSIPIYFEGFTPKTHLAKFLQIARSTLISWDAIAFKHLSEYRDAYPKRPQGALKILAPDREAFLTPYQCWVLQKVGRLMMATRKAYQVENYLKANPKEFSEFKFQATYSQVIRKSA
ncbi:hypothetical protein NIES2100_73660 [Calothrix sp. NIES-2100]|uniref:hypothetical protein n=1 Tax=Calothrix sp. NIES-2100 TaxID=1954172 RepID=UPI000B600D64|nr:hypothetical protein NIES2100_73660 [Calothrix sp. NIES-2100]